VERLAAELGDLRAAYAELSAITEPDLRAELAGLRAQRDAALAVCDEVLREYPGMGRGGIALDVRAALGVQPEPDLASVEEADMQAEHDAEFHGGPV